MLNLFKKKEELVTETSTVEEEPVDFLQYYVEPHQVLSKTVTEDDLEQVIKEAHILYNLCFTVRGRYAGGFAVHSSQINDKNPLSMFVMATKECIINPVIVNHTKTFVDSFEACLSFPERGQVKVQRHNKLTVEYNVLTAEGKISERIVENMNGKRAQVFAHEIDHGLALYIYS